MLILERADCPHSNKPSRLIEPQALSVLSALGALCLRGRQRLIFRFSADVLPLFDTSSKSTTCPSLRLLRPARSTAEICKKTSLPPLNHFTVPLGILSCSSINAVSVPQTGRSLLLKPDLAHYPWRHHA